MGKSISDKIASKISGRDIETVYITLEEMVEMVEQHFIQPATTQEEYDAIWRTVKGSWFLDRKMLSKDERYEMRVCTHRSVGIFNLKDHNYLWIHDTSTDKYYEYRSFFYGKFKKAIRLAINSNSAVTMKK